MAKKPASKTAPAKGGESAMAKAESALVRMVRDGEAPNEADVHPDEVENFAAAGWVKA